ncbi:MAG: PEP-CTERM sorting domain-containing protein, partial [Thermodesulfobacteria bacterium]|nr:PEP-CTERM sorting domain-containing protein [Thermodesulfobacteriota bacterium]
SGVTFGWELYRDETSTELAEPGDSILTAVLTLSGGNLQTLNSQLAALEYAWESSQNGPSNLNYIDGSLETSFTLRADPVPEPATGLLVLAGLPLLYWVRRKVKS